MSPKSLEVALQQAGVVLSDPKKWLKKHSPVMQMWELFIARQYQP